ncbi:Rrf2 family transcriptional regulator [Paenibacillus pasadenensis]|uniref:Rrf2 family transcriptional regulator n=1 Tax=Paenibacillus pasadenensis TaxID=217090 RepID=UPI00203ABD87|nr:Rrf2 family transcriptional regulator [Paenibacillus pasadenensis]MCM3747522.1 Rrf2 family transcriptional regulator [Paenibacillus pasadenensis]
MKKISSRFSIAVHILSLISMLPMPTGDLIAASVNTNPVIIRKIIAQLKKAGLVNVRAGTGGASLSKTPAEITLLDVYRAVEVVDGNELFNFHEHPNPACFVGANIENALRESMLSAQAAMEQELASVTIERLANKIVACGQRSGWADQGSV